MSDVALAFGRKVDLAGVAEGELLAQLCWLDSAPEDLRQFAQAGRFDKFWRAWSTRIASRADRRLLRKRVATRGGLWPWTSSREHPAKTVWSLIENENWPRLSRWATQQLTVDDAWQSERTELELLALAEWLWSGPRVDATTAWPVWRLVLTRTLELAAYLAKPLTCELTPDRRLLVTGELPWLLGQLFADIDGVTEFKQLGQQSLRNELIELTDGDGTPAASLLPVLPHWLASLARSAEVGAIVGEPLLEGEARFRFEDVVSKAVTLLDRDGRMLGVNSANSKSSTHEVGSLVAMLLHAAELAGLDELSLAAESLRFRQHVASGRSKPTFRSETFSESPEERLIVTDTDLPATQSDWAGWACLRSWWHATANTALVRHDGPAVSLQLSLLGVPVVDGEWGLRVRLDGQPLQWTESWKCNCWSSDTDMDYAELQLDIPGGPMLCRQVMLSRKDQFLVLADSVSKAGRRRIDLESTLPLRRGVRAKSDSATREMRLSSPDLKVRCFPLALPDDRLHSTVGEFDTALGELRLAQASSSESLYAPIVLDWSPERASLDAEWRTLTVTEEGRKLAPWEAAGHRLRLGSLHLVVFRSLHVSEDFRSVLGLYTDKESVIARFDDRGYVLPIVSVDA
ncbi:MAG: hypothetical protein IAG10_26525 [Planctomycetaceae bacterium]|nr:hypothetical protein [Planctomycetaceae bacterium]